jgi:hypothetical protein
MPTRLCGIYIDLVEAESLAGVRVVLVEQYGDTGPVIMRASEGGASKVVAAMSKVSLDELAVIMESLYAPTRDQMAS